MKVPLPKKSLYVFCFSSLIFLVPVFADSTVELEVRLKSFSVRAKTQTAASGPIRFVAKNVDTEEHELVVRKKEGGLFKEMGEIEAIAPGTGKELTLQLPPGRYELSCQIVEKEEGETIDHYKKGMHRELVVR